MIILGKIVYTKKDKIQQGQEKWMWKFLRIHKERYLQITLILIWLIKRFKREWNSNHKIKIAKLIKN